MSFRGGRADSRKKRTFIATARFAVAVLLLAGVALTGLLPAAQAAEVAMTSDEARMLQLVNQARADAGLSPLYPEQQLTGMARDLSAEMRDYGFFSHDSPVSGSFSERIESHGITGWDAAAENIANAGDVDRAFELLWASEPHRNNMMDPRMNCIGIGIVASGGGVLVTQDMMHFPVLPPTADTVIPGGMPQPGTFDTYLLLFNPGAAKATANIVIQKEDGNNIQDDVTIEPGSRFTYPVVGGTADFSFSTGIYSDTPLVVERAVYFELQGRDGGHAALAAAEPATQWYFAEGYTGGEFDTYILLQNPNAEATTATLEFMTESGQVVPLQLDLAAGCRGTVFVDGVAGLGAASVSTKVSSGLPIVAERAMYFTYQGYVGGHASMGAPALSPNWYFAEGYTGGAFDTYVLLQNPGTGATTATLELMKEDGSVIPVQVDLPARSRRTLHVDGVPGLENASFSTRVTAGAPIVAERAMYFSYLGREGGHDTVGASAPASAWYFAEGYTGGAFDTYVLLQNPNDTPAVTRVSFMRDDGKTIPVDITLEPRSRRTIHADEVPGLENAAFSTKVSSNCTLVAERAMYFDYGGRSGGHVVLGADRLGTSWFLAEGCVR